MLRLATFTMRKSGGVAAERSAGCSICSTHTKSSRKHNQLLLGQVTALPPSATMLASSPTAPYEMWSLGDGILAVQGHPEFSAQLVLDKVYPTMVERGCAACSRTAILSRPKTRDCRFAFLICTGCCPCHV